MLSRILLPLFREQIAFNRQLVGVLDAFVQRIEFFGRAYDNFENAFDNVEQAIIDAHKREVLLTERLELIQRQGFVRYQQAVGSLHSDVANAQQTFERATSELCDELRELRDAVRAELKDSREHLDRSLAGSRMRLGESRSVSQRGQEVAPEFARASSSRPCRARFHPCTRRLKRCCGAQNQ